jgi:DNA-binding NarL/FixJ family response regulator
MIMMPIRILLVSSSPVFLHAAMQVLWGHDDVGEVLTAQAAPEAVALVHRWTPAVVFLDEWLPGTNAAQVVRQLKAQPGAPRVVLMTMEDPAFYRNAISALGADGVIRKCKFTAEARAFCSAITKERGHDENISRWI